MDRDSKKIGFRERFWAKVRCFKTNKRDCWEWGAGKSGTGYGSFNWGTSKEGKIGAHRASWLISIGEIPMGMEVLHRCDNPGCVRPSHLFLGSTKDNSVDKVNKKRHAFGARNSCAKLTEEQIIEIRSRYYTGEILHRELAEEFGVSRVQITNIINFKRWKKQ